MKKRRKKNPQGRGSIILAHCLTIACFVAAVVPFRAADVGVTGSFFSAMLGLTGGGAGWTTMVPLGVAGMVATLTAGWLIVFLLPNTQQVMTVIEPALEWGKWSKVAKPVVALQWRPSLGWAVLSGAFLFCGIAFIMRGTTEFIYFNF